MAISTRRTWTAEEDEILLQLALSNKTAFEISQKLERSVPSIKNRAQLLRISLGHFGFRRSGVARWG